VFDSAECTIRRARDAERTKLLVLWERAVRATHLFLGDGDILALRPLVADELASRTLDWWVMALTSNEPIAFLGLTKGAIEALFVDPNYHRKGVGAALVEHAQRLNRGSLAVDVNEQNTEALRFYQALGFAREGRSDVDGGGRPFPILHLRRPAPMDSPDLGPPQNISDRPPSSGSDSGSNNEAATASPA
jgi:putative acetyltransferase